MGVLDTCFASAIFKINFELRSACITFRLKPEGKLRLGNFQNKF